MFIVGFKMGNFLFGMGMLLLLYFVVIKCWYFLIRFKVLEILWKMGRRRELFWDVVIMCRIGEVMIEREYGFSVVLGMEVFEWDFLEDEKRVRDLYMEDEVFVEWDDMGNEVFCWRIYLFVCDGKVIVK